MNLDELKNEKKEAGTIKGRKEEVVQNTTKKVVDAYDILPPKEPVHEETYMDKLMKDLDDTVHREGERIDAEKAEYFENEFRKKEAMKLIQDDEAITEVIDIDDDYDIGENGVISKSPLELDEPEEPKKAEAPKAPEVKKEEPTPVKEEDDDDDEIVEEKPEVTKTEEKSESVDDMPINIFNEVEFDDEDFEDIFDDDEPARPVIKRKTDAERLDEFKEEIRKNLPENNLDLSKFTIQKKAISSSKVLNFSKKQAMHKTSDWGLFNSGKPITLTSLSGSEIEKFNPNYISRNNLQAYKEIYGIIYNHLLDENKPDSFEKWTKTILFYDNVHLLFAVYKACFEGLNIVPYTCPNRECSKGIFMESIPVDNMVKYPSDEVKEECLKIISKCEINPEAVYDTDLVQISDNYAIAFKAPTLYDVLFEPLSLDKATREKYADVLGSLAYIDEMYFIDQANARLIPIDTAPVANNMTKTVKRKLKVYSEIINTFNSDEYNKLLIATTSINNKVKDITYVLPETHCPVCGTIVKEEEVDPLSLVFERHQYRAIKDL